ncbi:HAD family hydrolase [Methylocella silvestris]|nr:HAD family hydrolase [Methylocella silvestris]
MLMTASASAGDDHSDSAQDPLPSWNEGATKQAIIDFVADVTREDSPHFEPRDRRIAVFDNDGTLWVEQPMYAQMDFALEELRKVLPLHPEWRDRQPFKAAIEADFETLLKEGARNLQILVGALYAGTTPDQFDRLAAEWLAAAVHPRFERRYTELVYQPMREVMAYFRANGFKTFIVTGGGAEFVRAFAEQTYDAPPEEVIGSGIITRFESRDGRADLYRFADVDFVDEGPGKPVGIESHIGRRPIAAFGNSDGDLEMLEYTTGASGRRLGLIVRHTDAAREYAYDKGSPVGHLERALEGASSNGWIIADMRRDWRVIFPFDGA